jgi:tetratricopeptide (TPR) repeat protein
MSLSSLGVKRFWMGGAVALLAGAVYLPSLDNALVYDDQHLVELDRRFVEPGQLIEVWSNDYWPGTRPSYNFRPLTTTSFALASRVGIDQRLINILLHAGCSVAAFILTLRLGISFFGASFAGALFALHPLHSEAIYLVVGRSELLAALMGLLFLILLLDKRPAWLLSLLFGAALLSKESAIFLPLLGLLLWRMLHREEPLRDLARVAARIALLSAPAVLLLFALRHNIFGVFLSPTGYVNPLYNPLVSLAAPLRWLNALWVQFLYLASMAAPLPLRADYSWQQIELIRSFGSPRAILTIAAVGLVSVFLWAFRRKWPVERTGLIFVVLALLPVSNIFFSIGVMFGERLAYLPLFGFCLACAALLQRAWETANRGRGARLALLLLASALLTYAAVAVLERDRAWQDEDHFTSALVTESPKSALAHGLRFLTLKNQNDTAGAEAELLRAIDLYPAYYDAWDSYGELLVQRGDYRAASAAFVHAAEEVSNFPVDAREAFHFYVKAIRNDIMLGRCSDVGRHLEAAHRVVVVADLPTLHQLERHIDPTICPLLNGETEE